MAIDAGAVQPADVALVGARNLDPPEAAYLQAAGIDDDIGRALDGCDRVYVAFDCDVLRPGELAVLMPEPGGPTLPEAEELLRGIVRRRELAGLGLTGLRDDADTAVLARLATAAGL
jgi:arginase family enzyme